MQSAEDRQRKNVSDALDGSGYWCILGQREMRSSAVVVLRIRAEHVAQMPLAENDHLVETLASNRADQPFGMPILPRRARRYRSVANAHRANAARKCLAVDPIPITDEVLGRALPTACLGDLPGDPFGSRMRSDPEPQDAPSIVSEDQLESKMARTNRRSPIISSDYAICSPPQGMRFSVQTTDLICDMDRGSAHQ